jgi:hypothetical protein
VKRIQTALVVVILAVAVGLRLDGLDRSLWLDEAWVANSVLAPDLRGMFFYEDWLQTSPPLFLLLVRGTVKLLGASNLTFRLVPLLLSFWACVAVWLALRAFVPTRRYWIVPLALASFAWASPAVDYARHLKQYSGDMAVAASLLWLALRHRKALLWALPLAVPLSYGSMLLAPGLIFLAPRRFVTGLATAAAGASVYGIFILPNSSEALVAHWQLERHGPSQILGVLGSFWYWWLAVPLTFVLAKRRRTRLLLAFTIPVTILLCANYSGHYPATLRTSLFLAPSAALALAGALWRLVRWAPRLANAGLGVLLIALAANAYRELPSAKANEAMDEAVSEVYAAYEQGDGIYVHASVAEGFRLYASLRAFEPGLRFQGRTSWACCPRHLPFARGRTDAVSVNADLRRLFAGPLPPRLWILWTNRAEHWTWVGHDDRPVIAKFFDARGCKEKPTPSFENVGLHLLICGDQK